MDDEPLKLRDYQEVAVQFLQGRPQAGLFLDMGLGKTAIVLSALEDRHLPALVVAPKRVAEDVWDVERDLWRPDLSIARAVGEADEREAALRAGADITVISRDNFGDAEDIRPRVKYRTLVVDELSGFKTKTSVRWRTARRMINQLKIPHVWGLTGTPVSNGYMDLFAQVALLDGGERLGLNQQTYTNRYFTPGRTIASGRVVSWDPKPEAEDRIKEKIEDICLSMETDGRVQLPPITYNTINVKLPRKAAAAYNDLTAQLIADLRLVFSGGQVHTAANAAVLLGKQAQITAGFLYSDDKDLGEPTQHLHMAKIDAVKEIVEATDSPVLVFYRFTEERELLLKHVKGAVSINSANSIKRWNRGEIPVLVAHPQSAGHGLNLQHGGHTVVWTTLTWALEDWEQANKRVYRSGQKHPVVIHRIMVEGSVDYLTAASLETKAFTQDELLAYLESPI